MTNKGKAKDKDKHHHCNRDINNSSSGTRHCHNMDGVRIMDSYNET